MIEVPVIDQSGQVIGKEELQEQWLGGYVRKTLLKEMVLMYEANRHIGLSSTKTRGEIRGSTHKKWRQKGTGRARIGAGKVCHHRGGGVAHGPRPRDISRSLPKRARRQALQSALLAKFKAGSVQILSELEMENPKTKILNEILQKTQLTRKCLLVTDQYDKNILLSSRNIPNLTLLPFSDLNAYDVLRNWHLVLTKKAFGVLEEKWGGKQEEEPVQG